LKELRVPSLTESQQDTIRSYLETFGDRLRRELSDEGWSRERREKSTLFRRHLSPVSVVVLPESAFREVAKSLWALHIWTNKDWKVDDVIARSGLANIREGLAVLLYGDGPIAPRYDRCRQLIKGLGSSSITEIMCFVHPDKYPVWNNKPKSVLPLLGMKTLLPGRVYKYQLNGRDYERCVGTLALVRDEMRAHGFADADFLDMDILMWLLFLEVVSQQAPATERVREGHQGYEAAVEPVVAQELEHWDAMGILLELGNLLGYDTYTSDPSRESTVMGSTLGDIATLREFPPFTYERHLDTARRIDVVWFNEGFPSHCFEVECTTGVTSGLLRLYQIRNFTTAKFFIVSPAEILGRYQSEIAKDPFYAIRERYEFKSFDELVRFFDNAKEYHRLREQFLGR
jgi:hypothetical protein